MPQLPPTSTSSSTITGSAPTGSSTPPIWLAAEMWQCAPICAQLPISACESTMVPSPTYAPTLMYIGGMQVTFWPRYAPSRTLDPPGTMRMFFSGPNCCTGYVLLSRKLSVATDISTFAPMRNPSRMPFFTHALTFQPVELAGSGSAARISPRLRASRNLPKVARLPALYSAGLLSKSCSISVCMMYQKAAGFEHLLDLRLAGGGRRDQRETPHRFEQAHHRHRGLHGSGAGLDEVDVHQRQE